MALKKKKAGYQGTVVNADGELVKEGDPSLIVDLPDGQKLIVGELPEGTIIEVATWRGTGRPDSRANRLLLGVGSASSFAAPAEEPKSKVKVSKKPVEVEAEISDTQPVPKVSWMTKWNIKNAERKALRKQRAQDQSIKRPSANDEVSIRGIAATKSESIDSSGLDAYLDKLISDTLSGGSKTSNKSTKKTVARKPVKKSGTAKRK